MDAPPPQCRAIARMIRLDDMARRMEWAIRHFLWNTGGHVETLVLCAPAGDETREVLFAVLSRDESFRRAFGIETRTACDRIVTLATSAGWVVSSPREFEAFTALPWRVREHKRLVVCAGFIPTTPLPLSRGLMMGATLAIHAHLDAEEARLRAARDQRRAECAALVARKAALEADLANVERALQPFTFTR